MKRVSWEFHNDLHIYLLTFVAYFFHEFLGVGDGPFQDRTIRSEFSYFFLSSFFLQIGLVSEIRKNFKYT